MEKKPDIENAITKIVEMVKNKDAIKASLAKATEELKSIVLQKKELLDEIAKIRNRKDLALKKMRETEAWAKEEITRAKSEANSQKRLSEKKRKEIFDEMMEAVKGERERNESLLKENKDLEDNIKKSKNKLQKIKEGINC